MLYFLFSDYLNLFEIIFLCVYTVQTRALRAIREAARIGARGSTLEGKHDRYLASTVVCCHWSPAHLWGKIFSTSWPRMWLILVKFSRKISAICKFWLLRAESWELSLRGRGTPDWTASRLGALILVKINRKQNRIDDEKLLYGCVVSGILMCHDIRYQYCSQNTNQLHTPRPLTHIGR